MYLILINIDKSLEYGLMGFIKLKAVHIEKLILIYSVNYDFRNRYIHSLFLYIPLWRLLGFPQNKESPIAKAFYVVEIYMFVIRYELNLFLLIYKSFI